MHTKEENIMTTIYCIFCDNPKEVDIDQIKKGQFVTCEKCGEMFNLFGIYDLIYNVIPLAKKIVDILTSAVYSKFHFLGKESDLQKIDQFSKASGFDSLLLDIVFDTVLYGNAFIEKAGRSEGFTRIIDPKKIEIVTSWKQRPPRRSLSEEIDKLIQHIPTKREIHRSRIFHFVGENITEPIGTSVLGFWFNDWYRILIFKQSQIKSFIESIVLGASGVPHHLVFPKEKYTNAFKKRDLTTFQWVIRNRRRKIRRVIEREVLPVVLGRPYDRKETPKFEFI